MLTRATGPTGYMWATLFLPVQPVEHPMPPEVMHCDVRKMSIRPVTQYSAKPTHVNDDLTTLKLSMCTYIATDVVHEQACLGCGKCMLDMNWLVKTTPRMRPHILPADVYGRESACFSHCLRGTRPTNMAA